MSEFTFQTPFCFCFNDLYKKLCSNENWLVHLFFLKFWRHLNWYIAMSTTFISLVNLVKNINWLFVLILSLNYFDVIYVTLTWNYFKLYLSESNIDGKRKTLPVLSVDLKWSYKHYRSPDSTRNSSAY